MDRTQGRWRCTVWVALAACWGIQAAEAADDAQMKQVVQGNTAFALRLYQHLAEREGSLFLSPYSVSEALAMTYAGARGETARQMAEALHFPPGVTVDPAFSGLDRALAGVQEAGHVRLHVANSLWPQKTHPFLDAYLALMREYYGVSVSPVDYAQQPEAARRVINQWVGERTEQRIPELIPSGVLDALTRLVLANAIYFKGNWASRFDPERTEDGPFHLAPGEQRTVPFMMQKHRFGYRESGDIQVLELPYDGEEMSMIILLPRDLDGMRALEQALRPAQLAEWTSQLSMQEVLVSLPRFKLEAQFRLDEALVALGMRDAFDMDKANFSGMDGREDWLYIGAVLHQACVEVNEEGTEAAAATAVVMQARGMPRPLPSFKADHPFVFLIRHAPSGSVLFMGRCADPGGQQ